MIQKRSESQLWQGFPVIKSTMTFIRELMQKASNDREWFCDSRPESITRKPATKAHHSQTTCDTLYFGVTQETILISNRWPAIVFDHVKNIIRRPDSWEFRLKARITIDFCEEGFEFFLSQMLVPWIRCFKDDYAPGDPWRCLGENQTKVRRISGETWQAPQNHEQWPISHTPDIIRSLSAH